MAKKLALVFLIAFAANYVWEHLHSLLYAHYKGGPITELILLRATLGDAVIITLLAFPFLMSRSLARHAWLLPVLCVLASVLIELYALPAGRWAYNGSMPLIPILGIGLTPTIQLGILGYLSYRLALACARR
jgi:hypothetical protein